MRTVYFLSLSVFLLHSCTWDKAIEPGEVNTDSCIEEGQTITYIHDMKPIVETYCAPNDNNLCCHQPNACGYDFTIYENLAEQAESGELAGVS